jgi:hypothetical protein
MPQESSRPPWWGAKAQSLLGQRLLLGVTVVDEGGEMVAQAQFHGRLVEADPVANWTVTADPDAREAGWSGLVLRKTADA